MIVRIGIIIMLLALAGCGFEPIYADRSAGSDALDVMQRVAVQAPASRDGEALKADIEDRLNPEAVSAPAYYQLITQIQAHAEPFIIEPDGTASRYTLRLVVPYRLVRISDNQELTRSTVRHEISYNVSELDDYATIVAQRDAMRRGLTQIAEMLSSRVAVTIARATLVQ